jgi:tetratricopeptide (TPR) repeat protein
MPQDELPHDLDPEVTLSRLLEEAQDADRRGETERALTLFEEALALDGSDPGLRVAWGRALMTRARYREALAVLRDLCQEDEGHAEAHRVLGEVLHRTGADEDALQVLGRAADLEPSHPRPWYLMGLVHDRCGRPEEAAAMYRHARERSTG